MWCNASEIGGYENRPLAPSDGSALLDGLDQQIDIAFLDAGTQVRCKVQSVKIDQRVAWQLQPLRHQLIAVTNDHWAALRIAGDAQVQPLAL